MMKMSITEVLEVVDSLKKVDVYDKKQAADLYTVLTMIKNSATAQLKTLKETLASDVDTTTIGDYGVVNLSYTPTKSYKEEDLKELLHKKKVPFSIVLETVQTSHVSPSKVRGLLETGILSPEEVEELTIKRQTIRAKPIQKFKTKEEKTRKIR